MMKHFVSIILIVLVSNVTVAQENTKARFRAAVVKADITPQNPQWLRGYNPRQSNSVLDPLYHRIVALDDGKTQFFLISSDVIGIPSPEYDRVTSILQTKHGIDPLNVWWSATHTHSAPEVAAHFQGIPFPSMSNRSQLAAKHDIDTAYTAMLERELIAGILEARSRLQPARLGVGWGFSQANINRRAIDVDGKASLGLNPDGEVDRRIGVLRIDKEDGSPLALIANYPIHGTVLGQDNQKISGDAPGVVSAYVEQKIGAPVLFINGAAGNLAPIYSVYPNERAGHLREFCVLLGDKIIDANKNVIASLENITLVVRSLTVETPRRPELGWSPDLAKYTRTTSSGINMVKLPIRFLKINDEIAIWSAPVEMFCEISNLVRERSPFPFTFYFGYTNGSLGYLPAASAWEEGGYEPGVSPFTPAVEKDLTEAVIGYLQGELRSPARR
ncbi:MAG: neutral/alkaline non-lysosomal ceramidase N-terminal domain-containing protein [Chryseosolibacter sp.]